MGFTSYGYRSQSESAVDNEVPLYLSGENKQAIARVSPGAAEAGLDIYADELRQEYGPPSKIFRAGYGPSTSPTWAFDLTSAGATFTVPTTFTGPVLSGEGATISLEALGEPDEDGAWDAAFAAAKIILADAGGTLQLEPRTYKIKHRLDWTDMCGFRIRGASRSAPGGHSPPELGGTFLELVPGSGNMDAQVVLNLAGSTQYELEDFRIGFGGPSGDGWTDADGEVHGGSYWLAADAVLPLCGIAITARQGYESANITLEGIRVDGSWKHAAIWAFGVSHLNMRNVEAYQYHGTTGAAIWLDGTNAAGITDAQVGGVTLNTGAAGVIDCTLIDCQAHEVRYGNGRAGHAAGHGYRINRVQKLRIIGGDSVSSNVNCLIQDATPSVGLGDPTSDVVIIGPEWHNASVYGTEANVGAGGHADAEAYYALQIGTGTAVKDLIVSGLVTDCQLAGISMASTAQLVNAQIRNVRIWKYPAIPLLLTADMGGAAALTGCVIDAGGKAVTVTNGSRVNTHLRNVSAATALGTSTGIVESAQATWSISGNVAGALAAVTQSAANTALQASAPSGQDAVLASSGNIRATASGASVGAPSGTLVASSLGGATTPVANAFYNEAAVRAYAIFTLRTSNGACTMVSSYNVSDVSRTGVGDYTVTFRRAFASNFNPFNLTLMSDTATHYHVRQIVSGASTTTLRFKITDGASADIDPGGTVSGCLMVAGLQ